MAHALPFFTGTCAVSAVHAQTAPIPSSAQVQSSLTQALVGKWTGVLEYRDYSEPAGSQKRVELPTWLTIAPGAGGLVLTYTYDDGPAKILAERENLKLDLSAKTYTIDASVGVDTEVHTSKIDGVERLKDGRGTLVLLGPGMDNNKPAEIRITWTVRRNLLSWLEEVRPANSSEAFVFRHRYLLTRADVPAPTVPQPK